MLDVEVVTVAADGQNATAVNRVQSGRSPAYDPLGDLISSYAAAAEEKKPEPAKPEEKAPAAGNPKAKK